MHSQNHLMFICILLRPMMNSIVPRNQDAVIPAIDVQKKTAGRNVRSIVEQYFDDKLPCDFHPSFKQVGHAVSTETRPALPPSSQTEPTLKILAEENFRDEDSGDQDEEDTPYVLSLQDDPLERSTKIMK